MVFPRASLPATSFCSASLEAADGMGRAPGSVMEVQRPDEEGIYQKWDTLGLGMSARSVLNLTCPLYTATEGRPSVIFIQ